MTVTVLPPIEDDSIDVISALDRERAALGPVELDTQNIVFRVVHFLASGGPRGRVLAIRPTPVAHTGHLTGFLLALALSACARSARPSPVPICARFFCTNQSVSSLLLAACCCHLVVEN